MTDSFSTSIDPFTSFRGKYAQIVLADHQKQVLQQMKNEGSMLPGLPPPYQRSQERSEGEAPVTVGIIGAGAAGLYASLIIDSLEDERVTYEIFDANPMKDRKGGGRLFTYEFPKGGENDYYVSPAPALISLNYNILKKHPPNIGCWGHALPRHTIYEAPL